MKATVRCYNQLLVTCSFFLLFLLSSCADSSLYSSSERDSSRPIHGKNALQQAIQSLLQDITAPSVGIKVVRVEDSKVLYAHNSARLFHPASTMKLYSAAAALMHLGPQHHFQTSIAVRPHAIVNGTIHGDIHLIGSGDPSLGTDDIAAMVRLLLDAGIHTITGNILCDDSFLDGLRYGKGWMWDDQPYKDFAPISALSVNRNTVDIFVSPGESAGQTLHAKIEPDTRFITLENNGVTLHGDGETIKERLVRNSQEDEAGLTVLRRWQEAENIIDINGSLPISNQTVVFSQNIVRPALYAGTLFLEECQRVGIRVAGRVVHSPSPDSLQVVGIHTSLPVRELIIDMNKGSHNLDAELFLKVVGAQAKGGPGTAEKGVEAIEEMLLQWGINPKLSRFVDGSGVSRYNLVSPDSLTMLLEKIYSNAPFYDDFFHSLSIAGVDGHLEDRMKSGVAVNKVFAKTGSMSGVLSLAGYAKSQDGDLLAFTIMMEHFLDPSKRYLDLQDQICGLLCRFTEK